MNELYLKTVYTCKIIYDNIFGCLKVPSIDGACPNYCLRFILGFTCSFSYRVIFEIGISLSVCYFLFFFWISVILAIQLNPYIQGWFHRVRTQYSPAPPPFPVHWRTVVGKENWKILEWTRTQICGNILQKNMFKCGEGKIWVLLWNQY